MRQALGTPITTNWMFDGNISYVNGAGTAKFKASLTGPKGEASLVVDADNKLGGPWHYSVLEVRVPDGPTIDLKESTGPP
ncbi:MAG: cytochrome c oxidase assembly factor Coa1 family protein [Prosthecobacter sp.]